MENELKPWRYEIKYGPDGEDSYSWVYDDQGVMVAPMRTHKAKEVVDRMNTRHAPVDANPLASNPVDDNIASDANGNAPAATDTGLETGLWLRPIGPHAYATTKDRSTADDWEKFVKVEEYIPRSQAEELLAAERADHDNTIATLSSLIEDNAAQAARIKELDAAWSEEFAKRGRAEASEGRALARVADLEAKLAAYEKSGARHD